MRLIKTLTILVASLAIAAVAIYAADQAKTETKQNAKPDVKQKAKQDAPKELKNQTHCPVMGGKIDSTLYTDIQGQRVYHCCPMCAPKLKKDPDKFFKKAAAEGVLFENIQTTCPVSGKELKDKSVTTDYEGRRIAFCSKECMATFAKDPQKYLSQMDAEPAMMKMEGHEHQEHKGNEGPNR